MSTVIMYVIMMFHTWLIIALLLSHMSVHAPDELAKLRGGPESQLANVFTFIMIGLMWPVFWAFIVYGVWRDRRDHSSR